MSLRNIKEDIATIFDKDPAAKNIFEVFFCYPGLHALINHRIANKFYRMRVPFVPRVISQVSRWFTGIEIHPGATIGKRFFIDHGMGVVIGETTIIGDDVLVYQGVTLGGTGKESGKRHPTLLNNVVVGSGAKVLGNITIGNNTRIGAGSVVINDVPDNSTVVGIPGKVTKQIIEANGQLQHNRMPDPVTCALNRLTYEIKDIKEAIHYDKQVNSAKEEVFFDGSGI